MVIYVDIDSTICVSEMDNNGYLNYSTAKPLKDNIKKINKLYDNGNTIVYWTSRGIVSQKNFFELTIQQLHKWGAKFHELRMGKPFYDMIICDKSKRIEEI